MQRADANSISVDGVSADSGIGTAARHWLGGGMPPFTSIGSMHGLVSTDALEEFRIETGGSRADTGPLPGGQLTLSTRAGTNQLHGSVYEFLRNSSLDANDWFANSTGQARPLLQLSDFGATLGGPIRRDRTFFFASFEGLRLRQSSIEEETVPDAAARSAAPSGLRPWLLALPNGQSIGMGEASVTEIAPVRSEVNTAGLRLDHAFSSRLQLFSRYQHAPSFTHQVLLGGLQREDLDTASDSWTAGLDAAITHAIQNHLRVNYSRNQSGNSGGQFRRGGEHLTFYPIRQYRRPPLKRTIRSRST